jgi:hypothetical protein
MEAVGMRPRLRLYPRGSGALAKQRAGRYAGEAQALPTAG